MFELLFSLSFAFNLKQENDFSGAHIKAFPMPEESTFVWSGIMVKRLEKEGKSNLEKEKVTVEYHSLQSGESLNFAWHLKNLTFLLRQVFPDQNGKVFIQSST